MGKPLDIKAVRKRLNLNLAGSPPASDEQASASTSFAGKREASRTGIDSMLFEILLKVPVAEEEAGVDELTRPLSVSR